MKRYLLANEMNMSIIVSAETSQKAIEVAKRNFDEVWFIVREMSEEEYQDIYECSMEDGYEN